MSTTIIEVKIKPLTSSEEDNVNYHWVKFVLEKNIWSKPLLKKKKSLSTVIYMYSFPWDWRFNLSPNNFWTKKKKNYFVFSLPFQGLGVTIISQAKPINQAWKWDPNQLANTPKIAFLYKWLFLSLIPQLICILFPWIALITLYPTNPYLLFFFLIFVSQTLQKQKLLPILAKPMTNLVPFWVVLSTLLAPILFVGADWNILRQKKSNNLNVNLGEALKVYCESWRSNVELNNVRDFEVVPQECINHIKKYMTSSQYTADSERAIEEVKLYLTSCCCSLEGDGTHAWIFDVDDTLLSNIPFYKKHAFG